MALTNTQRDDKHNVFRLGSSLIKDAPWTAEYARALEKRAHTSPNTTEWVVANDKVASLEAKAGF